MSLIVFLIKMAVLFVLFVLTATGCGDAGEEQGDALDRAGVDVRLAIGYRKPENLRNPADDPELVQTLTTLNYYPRVICPQANPAWTCLSVSDSCQGGDYPTVCFETRTGALRACYRAEARAQGEPPFCVSKTVDGAGERGGPLTEYYCAPASAWDVGAVGGAVVVCE